MEQIVHVRLRFGQHNSSTAVFAADLSSREGKAIMRLPFAIQSRSRNHSQGEPHVPASTDDSRRTSKLLSHSRTLRSSRGRGKRHCQICVLLRRGRLFL